jgi:hypothetical protein
MKGAFMKKQKVVFTVILSILLVLGLGFTGCQTDDDSGGDDAVPGIGSITITGIKAGLEGAKIVYSTVAGTHQTLQDFTVVGGVLSGTTFDRTGSATISGGRVTIPVRGVKGGASYEFTNGVYNVQLTVSGADVAADNRVYNNLSVTFSGSAGTLTATATNGLGIN